VLEYRYSTIVARPAPAANRAIDIVNFLAAHPTESFTMSELARRLDMNGASAHAVLAVLTDAGYVVRHQTHKTYGLGPALVALGQAALERHGVIEVARREMRKLSAELGVQIVATAATPVEIVFLDRVGRYTARDPSPRVGERVPLVPPFGTVFMAWAPPATVEAWLARMDPAAADEERALDLASLDWVREHGYAVGLEGETRVELGRALAQLADEPASADLRGKIESLVTQLSHEPYRPIEAPDGAYTISLVAAPVFGPSSDVVLALSAIGFADPLDNEQVDDIGQRMRRAAAAITAETHGRPPTA
jgi:DNA-binding IclR family transcriptional regulator